MNKNNFLKVVVGLLMLTQVTGSFFFLKPDGMKKFFNTMRFFSSASGDFHFFSGPHTTALLKRYGNIRVSAFDGHEKKQFRMTDVLTRGQTQELRFFLLQTHGNDKLLDQTAKYVHHRWPHFKEIKLDLIVTNASSTPVRQTIEATRIYEY